MAVPFLACMVATAAFYHLPPRVLPSIHVVEGGRPGVVSHNTDGTDDFGVMQVNTVWLGPIARATGMSRDEVRDRLINQSCFSIAAAGAILRTYVIEERGNLMRAIGDYHSHTPERNAKYQGLVRDAAIRLFGSR